MNSDTGYRYETHCHTAPVSKCAKASVQNTVRFYKSIGYDGIFITNHFLDGNINSEVRALPYREQIDYYFRDFEDAYAEGKNIGLKVFPGVELSYKGTDFLIYGLEKAWYLNHPEILEMKKTSELQMMMDAGAFIVQAHPYREEHYIDHIRLFPRSVCAVETVNSSQTAGANRMASHYASHYSLLETYGSDNHWGDQVFVQLQAKGLLPVLAGMQSSEPVNSVQDFIVLVKSGQMKPFLLSASGSQYIGAETQT